MIDLSFKKKAAAAANRSCDISLKSFTDDGIFSKHMEKEKEKPNAAQKMWQNITSLFNKAALSVLVISNILPEILV